MSVFAVVMLLYLHPLASTISTRSEASRRAADVVRLRSERRVLLRRVQALRDPRQLERSARGLGMVRPGEKAYVVSGLPSK